MKDNFDLKKYLVENKATTQSQQLNEGEPIMLKVGDQITPDMLKNPSDFNFPMEIVRFSNDGADDIVHVKRILKKKGMFGGEKEIEDTFEDLVSNWERMYLKPHVRMSAQTQIDFDNPLNEDLLSGLADYKVAFDIAAEIGVTAAAVGLMIYKIGLKKTIEILKNGAKEFMEAVKYYMGKGK